MKRYLSLKRIDQSHASASKIRDVPSDQREVMFQSGRGNEAIRSRWFLMGTKATPTQTNRLRYLKRRARTIGDKFVVEPVLNNVSLLNVVLLPKSGDTVRDFPERHDTHVEPFKSVGPHPSANIHVSTLPAPHFGQDIGIQQKTHSNETTLFGLIARLRSGSKSKPGSLSARRRSTSFDPLPGAWSQLEVAATNICFACSERVKPLCAARSSRAATTSSSRLLINKCVMDQNALTSSRRQPQLGGW
jgi:hypothetical protein